MEIFKKMADIALAIEAIQKNTENKQQNFKFRGIDAIYNGVHRAMSEHGVFCVPRILGPIKEKEVTNARGVVGSHYILEIEYTFFAPDGSHIKAVTWGEAIDWGDKVINKCMAIAHKYALIQVFTIPTEDAIDEDPDSQSHEVFDEEEIRARQAHLAQMQAMKAAQAKARIQSAQNNPCPPSPPPQVDLAKKIDEALVFFRSTFGLTIEDIEMELKRPIEENEETLPALRNLAKILMEKKELEKKEKELEKVSQEILNEGLNTPKDQQPNSL